MVEVTISRRINAGINNVWNAWFDFGNIHSFHPGVKHSSIIAGPSSGVGAARRCDLYDGTHTEEVVTDFEFDSYMTWEMTEMPFPLKAADVRLDFDENGKESTDLVMTFRADLKLGPVGWLLGQLVVKRLVKKNLGKVLDSLNDHFRTGQLVGKDGVLLEAVDVEREQEAASVASCSC